jgi:lipid A 3-O-deacylase
MCKHFACFLLFISSLSTLAQDQEVDIYVHQVAILVDNDVFTSLYRDQYYSSGLFGTYSWLKKQEDSYKVIRSVGLVQRMFTPQFVSYENVNDFDRPYAGHLSILLNNNRFQKKSIWHQQLELGWMGPGTLTGDIHVTWHNFLGLVEPKGWEFEIRDSPIINYKSIYAAQITGNDKVQLLSETTGSLGTAFNYVRQEMVLRTGKLISLLESVQYNGQLGTVKPDSRSEVAEEVVLYYSFGLEHNIYNSTIEGNLIGSTSPHIESAVNWIIQHQFGLLFGWRGFDFTVRYYRRSKETTEATFHRYAGVQLAKRF